MMVTVTLRENLGPPMPKQNDDSCLQEDQEPYKFYPKVTRNLIVRLGP